MNKIAILILFLISILIQKSFSNGPVFRNFDKVNINRNPSPVKSSEAKVIDKCENFDNSAVSLDFQKLNELWYPLLTSKEPELRVCGRLIFTKYPNNSLEYEVLVENGERGFGLLVPDGKYRLTNGKDNSVTYILATDYLTYLITYTCKVDDKKYVEPIREWYTIYGETKSVNTRDLERLVTEITGKTIKFFKIEQNNCKIKAPISNDCLRFDEDDIVEPDFKGLSGNWTLRATSTRDHRYFHSYSLSEPIGEKLQFTTYFGCDKLGVGNFSRVIGSRVLKRQLNNNKAYTYALYKDNDYFISYVCSLNERDDNSENIKSGIIRVTARNGVPFDTEYLIDILTNRLKVNVLQAILPEIFDLEIINEDLLTFPMHGRHFLEEELAIVDFEKINKAFDLRFSTDKERKYNNSFSFLEGNRLRTYRLKGSEVFRNITERHIFGTRRIYRIANNKYVEVSYLYADENYLVLYEFCAPEENLRLYVRESLAGNISSYNQIIQRISPTALNKVKDLLPNLRLQYSSAVDLFQVDFYKTSGEWRLIQILSSDGRNNYEKTDSVLDGDRLIEKQYLNGIEVDEVIYSHNKGSNVLNLRSVKNGDGQTIDLYNDYDKRKVSLTRDNSGETVRIFARPPNYMPLFLPGSIRFDESDIVDLDFSRSTGKWVLKYYATDYPNYIFDELIGSLNGNHILSTVYYREKNIYNYTLSHITGSRVLKRTSEQFPEGRAVVLFNNYTESRLVYSHDRKGSHLTLAVRDNVQCNAINNNCLDVFIKLKPSVLSLISDLMKNLNENVLPYLGKSGKFDDNKLVDLDFSRNTGKWGVRLTSYVDPRCEYDEAIVTSDNNTLNITLNYIGQQKEQILVQRIRGSRILRSYSLTPNNEEKRYSVLYNDPNKYIVVYISGDNFQVLQLLARDGVQLDSRTEFEIISKIDPKVVLSVDDLFRDLKSSYRPSLLGQCKKLDENNILKVNFQNNTDIWHLRLTSKFDERYLYYGSEAKFDGQNLTLRTFQINGQEFSRVKKSRIYGTNILYINSSLTGEGREANLYNDYKNYKIVYTCDSNGDVLRLFARQNIRHNNADYDKIIAKIPVDVQKSLAYLIDELSPVKPYSQHCRTFSVDEVIDADFKALSGGWQLSLTSNTNGKEYAFVPGLDEFDSNSFESIRSLGTQIHIHTSRNRLTDQSVLRYTSGISSTIKYLYQDNNYVITYECNQITTKSDSEAIEFLRLFSRKNIISNSVKQQEIISRIEPNARNKILDLISDLKQINNNNSDFYSVKVHHMNLIACQNP